MVILVQRSACDKRPVNQKQFHYQRETPHFIWETRRRIGCNFSFNSGGKKEIEIVHNSYGKFV